MYLDKLALRNFRNYDRLEVNFHPDINIIFGANGQGKTNILEAVFFLSASRSFRTTNEQELINWSSTFCFLEGIFHKKESQSTVSIGYEHPRPIKIKYNNSDIKRASFIHKLPIVVFSPEDLFLIKEGPALRRRFLNAEGSRLKPLYYKVVREYSRVLQQRNYYLKDNRYGKPDLALLEPWDQQLVSLGSSLIRMRLGMLRALEQHARHFFSELTDSAESLLLEYISSFRYLNEDSINDCFREQLSARTGLDLKRGYTSIGPHLDDFNVSINGYEARRFASQGQQRTAALALKMAEVALFALASGEKPILLLDDVLSEFDPSRQRHLFDYLYQKGGQAFISTALSVEQVNKNFKGEYKIFSVHKGKITNERCG